MNGKKQRRLWLATALAFALVFGLSSRARFIDGDEGYLLLAAKLVSEGKVPYRDFFFPQGPLLPYIYAALLGPFGIGWESARLLSGFLAAANGLLVVLALARRGASLRTKALGAFLFATTALVFAWLPIAKTYALSSLFLTGAYVASIPAKGEKSSSTRSFLVGLLCALATGVRLYCVAALPMLLWLLWRGLRRERGRHLALASGSFGLGLLPSLAISASNWSNAYHGLLGYHLGRSQLEGAESFRQKFEVLKELLGFGPTGHPVGMQVLLLLFVIVMAARYRSASDRAVGEALLFALGLALVSVLPTPTFVQYFVLSMPFVIEAAALGASRISAKRTPRRARVIASAFLVAYASLGAFEWNRYHLKGNDVLGVDRPSAWKLSAAVDVGKLLDSYAECGQVLGSWPGYLLESSAAPFSGLENHFSTLAGGALSTLDERRRRHVVSMEDLEDLVKTGTAPMVLVGNWQREIFKEDLARALEDSGYELASALPDVKLWVSPSAPCRKDGAEPALESAFNEPADALPVGGPGSLERPEPRHDVALP